MSSDNKLAIYPLEFDYKLKNPDKFLASLVRTGFVSDSATSGDNKKRFLPGEKFMRHLTFLGCSPSVGPGTADKSFNNYFIELLTSNKNPGLIASPRLRPPECPGCGNRDIDGRAHQQIRINQASPAWHCLECGQNYAVTEINWRYKLAVATDYIVVHGVFEGEAIPSDKFLDQLAGESGISWTYCYC